MSTSGIHQFHSGSGDNVGGDKVASDKVIKAQGDSFTFNNQGSTIGTQIGKAEAGSHIESTQYVTPANPEHLQEILKQLAVIRENLQSIPPEDQEVVTDGLEVIEAEAQSPTKTSKLKTAFLAIWGVTKDVATVANAVTALAERFGFFNLLNR